MKLNILLVRQVRVCYFSKWNNADKHGHSHRVNGRFGDSFLGDKKEVGGGDTGKKHKVVEISDDSDDETKYMDVKNKGNKVKVEVLNTGEGRRVMTRVKSVPRNTKKMMGKGVKGKKVEKMSVLEMNVEFGNGVGDGDCGSGSGGGVGVGSGCQDGCIENELEFFEGDDDIFVGLKVVVMFLNLDNSCYFMVISNGNCVMVSHEMFLFAPLVFIHTCDFFWYEFAEGPL
ncbi:hypothetical protein SCA6_013276 [Theobroma cacao]